MESEAIAVDEEVGVAPTGFVECRLRASAGQRDGAFTAADGHGAQVSAEEGCYQAGFAARADGRWCAVGFVGDEGSW
ncbi:hypothetical protein ACIRPN_17915 [Streptomyces sp. NPDC101230]|uniref:hypothetical protein n=1 Tax=Streptomyces TaxID=1883 RepID=UPI00378FCCBC